MPLTPASPYQRPASAKANAITGSPQGSGNTLALIKDMKIQKLGEDRINELKQSLIGLSDNDYYWQILNFLFGKVNLGQLLNSIQKQVLATEVLDAEVKNGGFDQFYLNWELEYIDEAIEGLKTFGNGAFVRLAQASKEIYLKDKENYEDKRNTALDALDEEYYSLDSFREKKLIYMKDNFDLLVKENK